MSDSTKSEPDVGAWIGLLLLANCALMALRDWADWDGRLATGLLAAVGAGFWLAVGVWVVRRLRRTQQAEGVTVAGIAQPWLWPVGLAVLLFIAVAVATILVGD